MPSGVPRYGYLLCPYCMQPTNRPDGMHTSCHVLANPDLYSDEDRHRAKRTQRRRELRHGARAQDVNKPRPCRCVETGEIFPSRAAAARKYANRALSASVSCAIIQGTACGGYHFENA